MARISSEALELVRNPDYLEPYGALFEKISFIHKVSLNSAWQAFKMNELDSVYLMPSQWENYQAFISSKLYQKQKEKGLEIEQIQFLTRMYYFIGWNQKNRLFQDKKVRRALSFAIDRNQIISHFLKGFASPITGPFISNSSSNDPSLEPLPFDSKLACKLLNEQGWKLFEHKGIRMDERGEIFQFKLMYYLKNELSQSICQYISNILREVGVDCQLEGVDYAEFLERYQKKDFDAIYMAWSLGMPPEDLSPTWSSAEAEVEGSTNLVGFKNQQVDLLLKKLKTCSDSALRKKYYREIHQLIYEEQPYTFLYVPHQIFLYRSYVGNVFIPKLRQDLINQGDIEEPCLRIFYFKESL
jgi:peptide/nickel transport system substrate-binding protein